jgi:hypothetical protein
MAKKEYDHSDHLMILSELHTLYKLINETQRKIDVAEKANDEMKELSKTKEKEEIPF